MPPLDIVVISITTGKTSETPAIAVVPGTPGKFVWEKMPAVRLTLAGRGMGDWRPPDERIEEWPDERIWNELGTRLGNVNAGLILEKGITPMRSFVTQPMQYGRLFLAGDSAHIVPPTGAKGLNLAVNDVRLLAPGLAKLVREGRTDMLDGYSTAALRRVWRAQDFSNYMTQMLHDLGGGPFERQLQLGRLEYIERSEAAARSLAENYVGLPAEPEF